MVRSTIPRSTRLTAPGDIFYETASGFQSKEPDAGPIRKDGIMWIASCTKLLASVCALQCVERGEITLDEDVARIVPELAHPKVVSLDAAEKDGFKLTPADKPITLRMLLTHSSGLPYEWGAPELIAWRKVQPPVPAERKGKTVETYGLPLMFQPGEGWVYGGGLDWAGEIVARLHGTTLGGYMQEHIFGPLGMDGTTFELDKRPDLKARVVRAGQRGKDGKLGAMAGDIFPGTVADHSGGGGLWSCVPDYIKVLGDLIKDEPTLLKRETVVDMLAKPQFGDGGALRMLAAGRAITAANAAPSESGVNYGLGGMALVKDSPQLPAGTLTWGGLPNLKWFIHPQLGVAAMYATQVMPFGDAKNTWLAGEFFKEVIKMHKD
jgi:CubicO group peptidase (beta-lactamase class C family)